MWCDNSSVHQQSNVVNGNRILIPSGVYTESLTLNKAVSLMGDNAHTTVVYALSNQRALTVTGSPVTATTIISGLTFTGGHATGGSGCPHFCGGGLLITGTPQLMLQNLIIAGNSADDLGGGIYAGESTSLVFVDVQVMSNTAGISGGGVLALGSATLAGGRFENNQAVLGGGGGLYADAAMLILTDTQFISNSAGYAGGAKVGTASLTGGLFQANRSLTSDGGGLMATVLTISGTEFTRNTSFSQGGE
jgi:predicted outer membrane repeat protein